MAPFPGFIGGSYPAQALSADCEDTVNMYVERIESPGGKNREALITIPGYQKWTANSAVADVGGRASLVANGRLFELMGGVFYEFDANGTPTKWGTVAQDANPGQLVFNGVVGGHVLIASGSNAYCFVLATNTFSQVLTGTCTQIMYCDAFFLAFNKATGRTQLSALNDGTTWPGNLFQRSKFADPAQAVFVDENGLVWTIGTETFEVRYNSGVGSQPFIPLSGLVGPYGIASSFAFAVVNGSPFWLSQTRDGVGDVVRGTGSGVQAVSNYAIANLISGYARTARIDDAEMLAVKDQGHTWLNIGFPSVPSTLSIDVDTQSWARRGKWNPNTGRFELWAPRAHAYAFGKHLITDRATGQVSVMDASLSTEIDGSGIVIERTAPALNREYARIPHHQLLLLCDVGVGVAGDDTVAGANPLFTLRCSDDGGITWGNERQAGIGRIGKYRTRVYFNRLGLSADRAYRLRSSDPVPRRIVNAFLNPTEAELRGAA
jgi:hypothetical protein